MKHIKLFEDFLNEQVKKINLDKLKDYLISEFSELPGVKDITASHHRIATYIIVKLEDDIKQLPDEVKKRTDKLLKNPPEGLLQIQASTGYSLGNALSFTMPSNSPVSTYKELFHICSGKT